MTDEWSIPKALAIEWYVNPLSLNILQTTLLAHTMLTSLDLLCTFIPDLSKMISHSLLHSLAHLLSLSVKRASWFITLSLLAIAALWWASKSSRSLRQSSKLFITYSKSLSKL